MANAFYLTPIIAERVMTNLLTKLKPKKIQVPTLRFTPTAWAKLMYLRDCGETEVGGFGSAETDDLLLVTDFQLVGQEASFASVFFDDDAVADFYDRQVDLGLQPQQFGRIWVHTHPGNSADPSSTDEECFRRVFGGSDWAVMFILARGGQTYARLQFNVGPGGPVEIAVEVDYSQPFLASDQETWLAEYKACVRAQGDLWFPEDKTMSNGADRGSSELFLPEVEDWRDPFYAEDCWYAR